MSWRPATSFALSRQNNFYFRCLHLRQNSFVNVSFVPVRRQAGNAQKNVWSACKQNFSEKSTKPPLSIERAMQQKADADSFRSMIGDDIGIQSDMNCLSGSTFGSRLAADCLSSSPRQQADGFLPEFMFAGRALASAGCGTQILVKLVRVRTFWLEDAGWGLKTSVRPRKCFSKVF